MGKVLAAAAILGRGWSRRIPRLGDVGLAPLS
jgi:hypothetical protein